MFGLFKSSRQRGDFWSWLAANTSRVQTNGAKAVGSVANELSSAFADSYPELVWEITPHKSGPWEFCVSADGNRKLFPKVRDAVSAAPNIRGWKIVAFRQRGPSNGSIKLHDRKLDSNDIWCEVEPDGAKARIRICIRGLTPETAKAVLGASLVLLDNAVGEHDAVVKISDLSNRPLTEEPIRSERFFPLTELASYLDDLGK